MGRVHGHLLQPCRYQRVPDPGPVQGLGLREHQGQLPVYLQARPHAGSLEEPLRV